MTDLAKSFAGKRVLVTGHTGFKGPWLLAVLDRLGATTMGYGLTPETSPSMYALINGGSLCSSVIGDLRDREKLTRTVADFAPDFIIHMAAQSLVRRSYQRPVETFESNVVGTMNVLEALRAYVGCCATVIITTDKVYAETEAAHPFEEDAKLGGHDPYSTSKAMCELLADSYRKSFFELAKYSAHGKSIATARAGNVIGGGDWCEDRLVPDIIRAMTKDQSVRVRNPRAVRPWQHVLEPLTGYLMLAAQLAEAPTRVSSAFNFGPNEGDVLEVETIVQMAINAWGGGTYHVDTDPHAPHETAMLQISSDKSKRELGWRPLWDAKTAVGKTVDWYRHALTDPLGYTRGQIDSYFAASETT